MTYEDGGAACLSVLTDDEFFGGSAADLAAARAVTKLPVLRKDFTVSAHDVVDARLMGADAVLLIVAALERRRARATSTPWPARSASTRWSRSTTRPSSSGRSRSAPTLVGVNQRDLVTFEVDHERALRMAAAIPAGVVRVAESGIAARRRRPRAARRRLPRRAGGRDPGHLGRAASAAYRDASTELQGAKPS